MSRNGRGTYSTCSRSVETNTDILLRDSLSTFPVWSNLTPTTSMDSKSLKILLAGYTAILVTALRRRYYEQAWGFLSEMKKLLHCANKEKDETVNIVRRCLLGDVKMVWIFIV